MLDGKIEKMDGDNAFAGSIDGMNFGFNFAMVPNEHKSKDTHPDYCIEVRNPRGVTVRVGSAWAATSRAGNDYFQLALNVQGMGQVRANAVKGDDTPEDQFRIIPMAA